MKFERQDDIRPLDLYWEDNIREEAGGELHVMEITAGETKAKVLIENSAACIAVASEALFTVLQNSDEFSHPLLHGFCWHTLRDLQASHYLAMSGHYRQANILRRSALEVLGYGVHFEEEKNEGEFEAWLQGQGEKPDFGDARKAIEELNPPITEQLAEDMARRWGKLSTLHHTVRGGDVGKTMLKDEEKPPLHPWSAYYDFSQLLEWYEDFIEDVLLISYVITEFWEIDESEPWLVFQMWRDLKEGEVRDVTKSQKFDFDG